MGGLFSRDNAKHIHLHNWSNPRVQECRVSVPLRLALTGLDEADASKVALCIANDDADQQTQRRLLHRVVAEMKPDQRAILLRCNALYIHNEFEKDIVFEIRGLFKNEANEESLHPDYTGKIEVFCPAGQSGENRGVDGIVYRPRNLLDETVRAYAGLEDAILGTRTRHLPSAAQPNGVVIEVFEEDDPLIEFIVTRSDALAASKSDVTVLDNGHGRRYYQVNPDFLSHIREVFRDTVFDELRYTRFEDTVLVADLSIALREEFHRRYRGYGNRPLPNVFVVVEFVYLLISPGHGKMRHREVKLT